MRGRFLSATCAVEVGATVALCRRRSRRAGSGLLRTKPTRLSTRHWRRSQTRSESGNWKLVTTNLNRRLAAKPSLGDILKLELGEPDVSSRTLSTQSLLRYL